MQTIHRELTIEEKNYVESKIANNKKSKLIGWLLWFFLGNFGAHRMYLDHMVSGLIMLLCSLFGWVLLFVPNFIMFFWFLIDAFFINKWTNQHNDKVRLEAIDDVLGRPHR